MASPLTAVKYHSTKADGTDNAAGRVFTYAAGTTTPQATYTTTGGGTPNANPVILDSTGRASIYLDPALSYKFVCQDSLGATVPDGTVDNWRESGDTLRTELANTISATKGAGMVGFVYGLAYQAGTVGNWINVRKWPHPCDVGAVGNNIADDTAKINSILATNLSIDFGGPEYNYKISGALALRTGHRLFGRGATITQTVSQTEHFNYEGKSNIDVDGLVLVGLGTDYNESDSARAVGLFGSGGESNVQVHNCTFTNIAYTPMRCKGATGVRFYNNTVVGPGHPTLISVTSGKSYGFLADAGCTDVLVTGNTISKHAQGVRIEASSDVRVISNKIHTITGQHGIYAGSALSGLQIIGNRIATIDLIGIKVQNADAGLSDTVDVIVSENEILSAGDQGILIYNSNVGPVYKLRNVVCVNNVVRSATNNGINLTSVYGGVLHGNLIKGCGQSGIIYGECNELTISTNKVRDTVLTGIRDSLASTNVVIAGNTVVDCATGATLGDKYGILVQGGSEYEISGNTLTDAAAKMQYGIFVSGGTQSTFRIDRNTVLNATDAGLRLATTATLRSYKDNYFNGTLGATVNEPASPVVASSAAVTLPQGQDVVWISGATNITSISPNGHGGRTVVLAFQAALTFTDGSNLNLAGNFVTTANDTITLACDGVSWNEMARSAN